MSEVSDTADPAAAAVRNYIEHQNLRKCLRTAADHVRITSACDVGCGYGRLTMILKEFAAQVTGFEREKHLVAAAQKYQPGITFTQTDDLSRLPCPDKAFDLALTFTVLQHMADEDVHNVIREMHRIVENGAIILVENTTEGFIGGDPTRPQSGITKGRPVSEYEMMMHPFRLVHSFPRTLEPEYPIRGSFMLFLNE